MAELPKDLREMNEAQFVGVFNLLRGKTKNWTEVSSELLKENPQFLFVIRVVLCLSQSEFAKLLKVDKQWVRHFESGRQGFKKSEVIPKCVRLIDRLLKKRPFDMTRVLEFLRINQFARKTNLISFPERDRKFKRIFEMTKEDFIKQFNFLKTKTNNFTKFDPTIILTNPELFSTFRIILNMNIKEFSEVLSKGKWRIRRWEAFKERMMPETANKIMSKIENLFKGKRLINITINKILRNFERFTFFESEEIEIMKQLEKFSISFDIHANLQSINDKILNVDFVIPSSQNPSKVIEVTKISTKKFGNIERRLCFIDHRFQLLKLRNPNLKTIMFVNSQNGRLKSVNRIIKSELVNTDVCILNDLNKLINDIKN